MPPGVDGAVRLILTVNLSTLFTPALAPWLATPSASISVFLTLPLLSVYTRICSCWLRHSHFSLTFYSSLFFLPSLFFVFFFKNRTHFRKDLSLSGSCWKVCVRLRSWFLFFKHHLSPF